MPTERRPRGRPKGFNSDPTQVVNQSLDRAIDLLATLAAGGAMTLSQLSVAMGQSSATLYRLLTTFQLREMVEVDPMTQAWSVGPATFRLGAAFLRRSDVVDRARPAMRRLMEETGETSNLGIERGHQVLFISQVETHKSIRAFFRRARSRRSMPRGSARRFWRICRRTGWPAFWRPGPWSGSPAAL